jgi:hypothetical protein
MKIQRKHRSGSVKSIVAGMIASISFCLVDSLFFLLIENKLNIFWKKKNISEQIIPILNGGLSSSVAIFVAVIIEDNLKMKYDVFQHPIIESAGMIVGTILILILYKIYIINNQPIIKHMVNFKKSLGMDSMDDINNYAM